MKPANSSILTMNGGSSSIRFAAYEAGETRRRLDGKMDRIGLSGTNLIVNAKHAPLISPDAGRVKVRVICTNEELMIARSVLRLLKLDAPKYS